MPPDSSYPADWLRLAEKDGERVERLLNDEDFSLAGFCLQQAIEKMLKAFLLSKGWQLRKIHHLDALLDDALIFDGSLEPFRGLCQRVTAFYFVERYPFTMESGIGEQEVVNAWEQAKPLMAKLRSKIAPAF